MASGFIDESLKCILNSLLDKEGRKGDSQKSYDNIMNLYGRDARLLSLRILDELLSKEQRTNSQITDFSKILSKDIFVKSVFVCAIETIFFIGNIRQMQVEDIL